jgi:enoyl-CoA hydratase/carnithine racemase
MSDRVRIEINPQGVAEVTLVRADKMNALDVAMFTALQDAIRQLETTPNLRAVVLSGEGKAFCAGLDMGRFAGMAQASEGSTAAEDRLLPRTHGMSNGPQFVGMGWRSLPVPVIAAVHGVAFGGGLQVALGADVRLLAPGTKMSVMELKWGLVPDMAGMALLRGLVRDDHARELIYSARVVEAEEAVALGLATRICADPLAAARELAHAIAQRSPSAIRAAKRLMNQASRSVDDTAAALLMAESQEQSKLIGSAEQAEAVKANLEKRPPVFGVSR